MQIEQGNALFLVAGEIATDEVQLGGAQAQRFAIAAAGTAAAGEINTAAAFQPLLPAEQPFAVATTGSADMAVPAQGEAVAVEIGGTVRRDADELVYLPQNGDARLQLQVVFRQVGGKTAIAFAVGDAGTDEIDAAVEQRRVIDAGVQGGAVPGWLAAIRAETDVQLGLAAEIAALIMLKLQFQAFAAQAQGIGAIEEGTQLPLDLRRDERGREDGDDEPDDGDKGKGAFDHGRGRPVAV